MMNIMDKVKIHIIALQVKTLTMNATGSKILALFLKIKYSFIPRQGR